MLQIEIDSGSGFCFGVTTAIRKAEEELAKGETLYCLGDIVHNSMECERLRAMGLITIDHRQMEELHGVKVLLRAHGEPPETYELARRNDIEIIDATCPVVLQLQKRIKKQYETPLTTHHSPLTTHQIVIFGKRGHAEVLGLVGQTGGSAIVIENYEEAKLLDLSRDTYLYSQTTKSLDEFHRITDYIQSHIAPGALFRSFDTAQHHAVCTAPRPHTLRLRTEEQQRACALQRMSAHQSQQPPHRRARGNQPRMAQGHLHSGHLRSHQHAEVAHGEMPRRTYPP